jgi:hypothetical protein
MMVEFYKTYDHEHKHGDGMLCQEVAKKVYAFIDGQMNVKDLEAVQEHINMCLPCHMLVEFERKLLAIIHAKGGTGNSENTGIPKTLSEKIKKAIELSTKK